MKFFDKVGSIVEKKIILEKIISINAIDIPHQKLPEGIICYVIRFPDQNTLSTRVKQIRDPQKEIFRDFYFCFNFLNI